MRLDFSQSKAGNHHKADYGQAQSVERKTERGAFMAKVTSLFKRTPSQAAGVMTKSSPKPPQGDVLIL